MRGVQRHVLGLQSHSSGCSFKLEWFVSINGTDETCQAFSFGDEGHAKSSMHPKCWLEAVLFGGKSQCQKRCSVATFGIHSHPNGCKFRLEWIIWIDGTQGTYQTPISIFGDGGYARPPMGPKRSLERVFFSLKSPCLRGLRWHVLGLQYHPSGCNLRLEWFV